MCVCVLGCRLWYLLLLSNAGLQIMYSLPLKLLNHAFGLSRYKFGVWVYQLVFCFGQCHLFVGFGQVQTLIRALSMSLVFYFIFVTVHFQNPLDGKHKVRVAVGNGLRSDIWETFKTRYNIPNICEFFGATEGTVALMNLSNRTGACGRFSPLIVRVCLLRVFSHI